MAVRRYSFRLYPNKGQKNKLFEARRNHAYLYNACIAHRRYEWKANKKTVTYFEQQNCLPAFKKEWVEFAYLHSQAMQATVKRVDLAYGAFFQGLRGIPKFKSIRNYSGWTYPAKSGWKVSSNGKHGTVTLNDLGITLKMRGRALQWGVPTTLTIAYRPNKNQWFASITVDVPTVENKFGSQSDLSYESIVAFDLGTETALTLYNGEEFTELENPRFTQKAEQKIKQKSKALRRKRAPNRNKKVKGSRRWNRARKQISKLQRKVSNQRKDWQHKVTSDIASRHDIGVTEQLNTKGMTRKATAVRSTGRQLLQRGEPQRQFPTEGNPPSGLAPQRTASETPLRVRPSGSPVPYGGKPASRTGLTSRLRRETLQRALVSPQRGCLKKGSKREARSRESSVRQTSRKKQKAGLNKSILCVGFGALNKMIAYKIEQKGGLMLTLPTKQIKPSQRCPNCGKIHKHWAQLSNRYHICDACGFEIPRDRGSVMVMYNVATSKQPGLGTSLADCGCLSSTNSRHTRKHTGSMRQLGQKKRQKSRLKSDGELETPSVYTAG